MSERTIVVPKEFESQLETVVDCLREALRDGGHIEARIDVERSAGEGLTPGALIPTLVIVSGFAFQWFTKKWLDEYVWPKLKARIENPSRAIIDWLGTLGSSDKAGTHSG